jgi:hypothetical protein
VRVSSSGSAVRQRCHNPIFLADGAVNPRGIPDGDDTGREIARHYRACADDGVVADRYSRA